jgi:CheY-like chemotaxis protein
MTNETLNILLADDEEDDRLLFVDALNELKIKTIIQTVNDGVELMEHLNNADNTLPQLIFLDLNMPRKNGLECLKEIKASDRLSDITIAIFSTSMSENDIEQTLINGANVYINKPNSFDGLKKALKKVVTAAYMYENTFYNKDNFMLRLY